MPLILQSKEGTGAPCYLIAEIGVNHNGDMDLARKMVIAAKESGADAVKFQTFTADTLVSRGTPKVRYQEHTTSKDETHYAMISKLELKREHHAPLMQFCEKVGVDFISTPYDLASASFLDALGVQIFKTASADIVDLPLQSLLARTGKTVIMATGMATMEEIREATDIYDAAANPNVALLHCVSNYPCSDASLNLNVITTLRAAFNRAVGFSDHSVGPQAAALSVALGASIIEKHFTLDKTLPGPDHRASATPDEFLELTRAVRHAELVLGSPEKRCQDEERQMAEVSRKSIVIRKSIKAGETLTADHLTMKRPGTGLRANRMPFVIGKTAKVSMNPDHLLNAQDLEDG
jgi:N,N'-diacetyllegionaminate synthase